MLPQVVVPQVSGVQAGTTQALFWQTLPLAQLEPQSTIPPHPSEI
jgi:hypothetical protein